jgi:outer membrane immunogenic protein
MKRFLLATVALATLGASAHAADLRRPVPHEAPPVPYILNTNPFSGFYAGINGGWLGGNVSVTDLNGGVPTGPFNYSPSGGVVGGTLGYDYALTPNWVIGIEGNIDYAFLNGHGVIGSASATSHQDLTLGNGVLADLTGKFGYRFGNMLVYARGGAAWYTGHAMQATTNPGYNPYATGTFSGWTAGGGLDYKFAQNWSAGLEGMYYDFGSKDAGQINVGDPSSPIPYDFKNRHDLNFVKVTASLKYHFN